MKLTEHWSIVPGPNKQDYQLLYEDWKFNEEKDKWVRSSQSYYYPTFQTAVDGFVRHTGIELVGNEESQEVIQKMEELKQTILKLNEVNEDDS